jgi:hypothetical protein
MLNQAQALCGLYCKHITTLNDDSSIVNKFETSLTDDASHHLWLLQVHSKGNKTMGIGFTARPLLGPGILILITKWQVTKMLSLPNDVAPGISLTLASPETCSVKLFTTVIAAVS